MTADPADLEALELLRWGNWGVRDGVLCLPPKAPWADSYRIPLARVGETHWIADFASQAGATPRDVAHLALALRDLRR